MDLTTGYTKYYINLEEITYKGSLSRSKKAVDML